MKVKARSSVDQEHPATNRGVGGSSPSEPIEWEYVSNDMSYRTARGDVVFAREVLQHFGPGVLGLPITDVLVDYLNLNAFKQKIKIQIAEGLKREKLNQARARRKNDHSPGRSGSKFKIPRSKRSDSEG